MDNTISNPQAREQVIENITNILKETPFTFEFKVKKKPTGVHIIYEITREEMNAVLQPQIN